MTSCEDKRIPRQKQQISFFGTISAYRGEDRVHVQGRALPGYGIHSGQQRVLIVVSAAADHFRTPDSHTTRLSKEANKSTIAPAGPPQKRWPQIAPPTDPSGALCFSSQSFCSDQYKFKRKIPK